VVERELREELMVFSGKERKGKIEIVATKGEKNGNVVL